jgi:hypothetical protein
MHLRAWLLVGPGLGALALGLGGCGEDEGRAIGGRIEAPPEVMAALTPTTTLFLAARAEGGASGPPMAAMKIVGAKLPYDFKLSADDVLMPGRPFGGKMRITAHLRRSGMVDLPVGGDASGVSEVAVEPGATGVRVRLQALRPEP